MKKDLDYVSDYPLESACKDAPLIAPSANSDWRAHSLFDLV